MCAMRITTRAFLQQPGPLHSNLDPDQPTATCNPYTATWTSLQQPGPRSAYSNLDLSTATWTQISLQQHAALIQQPGPLYEQQPGPLSLSSLSNYQRMTRTLQVMNVISDNLPLFCDLCPSLLSSIHSTQTVCTLCVCVCVHVHVHVCVCVCVCVPLHNFAGNSGV